MPHEGTYPVSTRKLCTKQTTWNVEIIPFEQFTVKVSGSYRSSVVLQEARHPPEVLIVNNPRLVHVLLP